MKWSGRFWLLVFSVGFLVGCNSEKEIEAPKIANYNIIPEIQSIDTLEGFFHINADTKISPFEPCATQINNFQLFLQEQTKFNIPVSEFSPINETISIVLEQRNSIESYNLEVTKNEIWLSANIGTLQNERVTLAFNRRSRLANCH